MSKITILQGLPASGKSTIAKEIITKTGNTKRFNKDDFRAMFDNSKWSRKNEKFVLKARDLLIDQALQDGFNVIVDDTNFHPKHIQTIKEIAKKYNAKVEIQFIDTPIEECIRRDLIRPNSVGEQVIRSMYNQFLAKKPKKIEYNSELPDCYIFDIDGTLAIKAVERSYFEWSKVIFDTPNASVVTLFKQLLQTDNKIFVFSGRDKICKEDTVKWLIRVIGNQKFDQSNLFMRELGNMEDDCIIKEKMYRENIENKYNVLGIFDDRPKVVRMWRSLGLSVFAIGDQLVEF
jgi:predicted kinase